MLPTPFTKEMFIYKALVNVCSYSLMTFIKKQLLSKITELKKVIIDHGLRSYTRCKYQKVP